MNKYKLEFTKERDDKIKSEICERYNLEWYRIEGTSRVRKVVDARRLYSGILRNIFRLTYHEIGDILNKNHATIIYGVRNINNLIETYPPMKERYEKIERALMLDDNYYIHEVVEVERKMEELSNRLKELIERKNEYKLKIQKNGRKELCSK